MNKENCALKLVDEIILSSFMSIRLLCFEVVSIASFEVISAVLLALNSLRYYAILL